jgi:flagellar basal body-associated protein FliL
MKAKLLLILILVAFAIVAAAVIFATQQRREERAAAESRDARRKAGAILQPDTGSNILGEINKGARSEKRPAATPAP